MTLSYAPTVFHIAAGSIGLISGGVALYSAKGAPLHRQAGMVFVYTMLAMTISGGLLAVRLGEWAEVNVPAALMSAYLVVTALLTVRPTTTRTRWIERIALLVAFAVGTTCLTFGLQAIARGGSRNGIPAFPFFLFGTVGLLGSALDLRMMRLGGLRGAPRVVRHLWRMCFALFIAAMSFFIGQADELPKALRIPALLALPVLAVLVTMFYWLWRVRIRRSLRGLVGVRA
jgi:uncharacterized membrane protein